MDRLKAKTEKLRRSGKKVAFVQRQCHLSICWKGSLLCLGNRCFNYCRSLSGSEGKRDSEYPLDLTLLRNNSPLNNDFADEVIRQKKIVEKGARKAALKAKKEIIEMLIEAEV